jgi:signal transduction histidine kinase
MITAMPGPDAPELDAGLGDGERRVLRMIAAGAPLDATLDALVAAAEAESPGMRGSFLRRDPAGERLFLLSAPRIPSTYMDAIAGGLPIGEGSGSCGTAAARRAPFAVDDIGTHPYWADAREIALAHGLRACWSTPVLAADGAVLGTFAMYYDAPRQPGPEMARIAGAATHLAAIAIERDALSRAERAARQAAEQASEARGRFIATMSHELRTPLNAILGYSSLLLEEEIAGPLSETQRGYLGRIRQSSSFLNSLIGDVLTLSRLENARDELVLEEVDLVELAREGLAVVMPMARARGLETCLQAPDARVPCRTDAGKVRQILLNLLANAVKFSHAGGVTVRVEHDGTHAHLRVRDTGIGIQPADLERIWEPFTQVQSGTTRAYDGAGLGLTLCRHLAGLLGRKPDRAQHARRGQHLHLLAAAPAGVSARSSARPRGTGDRLQVTAGNCGGMALGRRDEREAGVRPERVNPPLGLP